MVFLGAWALFGIGTLANGRTGIPMSTTKDVGRVLLNGHNLENLTSIYHSHLDLSHPSVSELDTFHPNFAFPKDDIHDEYPQQPSREQVLGRIFAWLCTTLYFTSRLPQIWKNVSHNHYLSNLRFLTHC
jgi:hypothetical protein